METKIIVDTSKIVSYSRTEKAIFSAIEHFGFYYKIIDLAFERFFSQELENTNLLILGQEGLGLSLGEEETNDILKKVYSGMGLVIFDGYIERYPESFLKALKIEKISPMKTSKIKLNPYSWICDGTIFNEIQLENEVIFYSIKEDKKLWKPFLFSEKDQVCGIYRYFGKGKVVIFLTSAGIWQDDILGHTEGLDDVFWRSLIWASKKPFITKTMPSFITVRINDCSGSGNKDGLFKQTTEKFRYIDVLNKYGFIPNIGLFIDEIDKKDIEIIKEKYYEGFAEFSPYGFNQLENIYIGSDEKKLSDNFKRVDNKFSIFSIRPSLTLNANKGEISLKAIPYLKERGYKYLMNIIKIGKSFNNPEAHQWNLKPYGKINFSLGEIPEGYFFNILSLPGNISENKFDFLYGCTQFNGESEKVDIEKAIKNGIFQIKRGLENKFFGCLTTSEKRISHISISDWEKIIEGICKGISHKDKIFKSYDFISKFAENRESYKIEKIEMKGNIEVHIRGKNKGVQYLHLFLDIGEEVSTNYLEIPDFSEYIILNFKI